MDFEHLKKYLTEEQIASVIEIDEQYNKLWGEGNKLESEARAIKTQALALYAKKSEIIDPAEMNFNADKYYERERSRDEKRREWKKKKCSKSLPDDCSYRLNCSLEYHRGDCPRGIEAPTKSDGNEWDCKDCKFRGRETVYDADEADPYDCDIYSYFCDRDGFLAVTEEELKKKKARLLKTCTFCYDMARTRYRGC